MFPTLPVIERQLEYEMLTDPLVHAAVTRMRMGADPEVILLDLVKLLCERHRNTSAELLKLKRNERPVIMINTAGKEES